MKKSHILIGAVALCSACQKTPPNVIVILADDQGWGDLSINGNRTIETPNIDRIGREGIQMDNFYVCPVSAPTRSELLTGKFAYKSGVVGVSEGLERMNPEMKTIANVFNEAGYGTALFGKWHNGTQYPYHPNARGFDEFYGFCSGHWGSYIDTPLLDHNGEIVTGEGFLSDEITQHAMDYIEDSGDKPFFVVLSMNIPHSPMQVTDEWWDEWKDKEVLQDATNSKGEDKVFTRAALALSDNVDWNVGRVLKFLEDKKKMDNTIIVYLSDNGPNSNRWNGEMKGIKASVDEGGVRSSLLMRWGDKLPKGSTVPQLSGVVDLLPTLSSLCGIDPKVNDLDGLDMSDYILGEKTTPVSRELISMWGDKVGLRKDGYLLSSDNELYNIIEDRKQLKPLAKEGELYNSMQSLRLDYLSDMAEVAKTYEIRPYTVGHKDEKYSRLPARDAIYEGGIIRSNKYPNCSYLLNWASPEDKIIWDVDVLEEGTFEVFLYYTCDSSSIGSSITCSSNTDSLTKVLDVSADSELHAAQFDRVERGESPMLKFQPWSMGEITLQAGKQQIVLSAQNIKSDNVMNMSLLVLKRI